MKFDDIREAVRLKTRHQILEADISRLRDIIESHNYKGHISLEIMSENKTMTISSNYANGAGLFDSLRVVLKSLEDSRDATLEAIERL